jgi:cytochrome b subunit of formate dehydrogenase
MNAHRRRILLLVFTLLAPLGAWAADAAIAPVPLKAPPAVPNSECMDCHEAEFKAPKKGLPPVWIGVRPELFAKSVHGGLNCVDCHDSIKDATHDDKLPPAQCASCHEGATKQFATSIHGVKRDGGLPVAATCTSCHGPTHDLLPVKHIDSPVAKFNLLATCAQCHEGDKTKLGLKNGDAIAHFKDSIHGQGLYKMGLNVSPSCNDCHGVHDIKSIKDTSAHTSRAALSKTCGACHVGVEKTYAASVHGLLGEKPGEKSAVCTDCHTAHDIERPGSAHFKQTSDQKCGACHEDRLANYRETYHGKAMFLGRANTATDVAACYDCHGHHDIVKHTDPRSMLSAGNIVQTCGSCHGDVNVSFTQYQPHADHTDGTNYPVLHWTYIAMTTLLVSVFAFFGVHTLLWITRFTLTYLRDPAGFRASRAALHDETETFRRFNPYERFLHMLVVTSFLALVLTGMPLKFYYTEWARIMFNILGGPEAARVLHHLAALVTFLYFGLHLASLARGLWRNRGAVRDPATGRFSLGRFWGALFGPDSMVPSFQDWRDFLAHLKWFLGRGPRPSWDRWTYWERFDYLAVFWGVGIIGLSGLVLWFPKFFTLFMPGWLINIAVVIHSDEALLAAGFIFTFHFFNTHFRLDKFPMDTVIFSGHISKAEMLTERRRWYDRLVASGKLEEHRVIHSDWATRRTLYKSLGFVFVGLGLMLLGLMIYALLSRLGH